MRDVLVCDEIRTVDVLNPPVRRELAGVDVKHPCSLGPGVLGPVGFENAAIPPGKGYNDMLLSRDDGFVSAAR